MIKFQGKKYPLRMVEIPGFGERAISVESLEDALLNADSLYVSDEAQVIDEKIFFYVPDDVIDDDDESLAWLIKEALA